jgi:hypothetical protein
MCLPPSQLAGSKPSVIPVGGKSLVSEPAMVVIAPRVNTVDFPSSGLAESTLRHLGWQEVTCVAFFTLCQARFDNKI